MLTREWLESRGLRIGQMRGYDGKIGHNCGWYNKRGEKLGWGDLSATDLNKVAADLPRGEVMVVLSEQNSFWNFVTQVGVIGDLCKTESRAEAPGVDYIAEHALFVVVPGEWRTVYDSPIAKTPTWTHEEAETIIKGKEPCNAN
jgi:hypothetical protein